MYLAGEKIADPALRNMFQGIEEDNLEQMIASERSRLDTSFSAYMRTGTLVLPPNFGGNAESLRHAMQKFIEYSVLSKWYKKFDMDPTAYDYMAKEALGEAKHVINLRITPVRITGF